MTAFTASIVIGYGGGILVSASQYQVPVSNDQTSSSLMQQNPPMMNQSMQQMMMNDQNGTQQMMQSMMQNNPQFMLDMTNQTQFIEQMVHYMRQNHNFTQTMIMQMMDDPQIRIQMIGHIVENQEFIQELRQATGNQSSSSGS